MVALCQIECPFSATANLRLRACTRRQRDRLQSAITGPSPNKRLLPRAHAHVVLSLQREA